MTALFDRFVAPARLRPQLWRIALSLVLIVIVTVAGTALVFLAAWAVTTGLDAPLGVWLDGAFNPDTAPGTLMILFAFLGLFIGPLLAARWLHKRPAGSVLGPRVRVLRDFVLAFLTVSALMGVSALWWSIGYDALPNLSVDRWLALLPLTILALLIQTGAEEVMFRGYLQQQLAARFRPVAVWLLVPSVLFGLMHYNPATSVETTWMMVGAATAFGLAAADLTARTGNLGAAWGFHFANNLFAVAILSTQGSITGLSLFVTPYSVEESITVDALILIDLGFLVLAWWLVRRVVAR